MSNKLFQDFKNKMKTNEELCLVAADKVLGDKTEQEIKENFSRYFEEILDEIYKQYLIAQKESGQEVIDSQVAKSGTVNFEDMDKFFMSIFQSRKSRAGKGFEFTIRTMFERLSYPFSEQVNIDGAKPDFVMPSESYFLQKPLDSLIFTAKRTLRERWRQVVTEANKGYGYFLATLDDKVTSSQIEQASKHKIYLVVPNSLKTGRDEYAQAYNVLSFESFFRSHLDPALKRWKANNICESAKEYKAEQKDLKF